MQSSRIGVIGGHERAIASLEARAHALGCKLEHHAGHTAHGTAAIEALIARADAVVICTDVNSHNAVHAARRACARRGVRAVLVRRFGPDQLAALVTGLSSMIASGNASANGERERTVAWIVAPV
jgi:hypothetical protein